MKIKLTIMGMVLIMATIAAAKPKAKYTFDPHSLNHSSYRQEDCTRTDDTMVCSKAYLQFSTMVYIAPSGKTITSAPPQRTVADNKAATDQVVVTFNPKQCKLMPVQAYTVDTDGPKVVRWKQPDAWECKHVTFRWVQ